MSGGQGFEHHTPIQEIMKSAQAISGIDPIHKPKFLTIQKSYIDDAIRDLKYGLEYAEMALQDHEFELGRATRRNKIWAQAIESDIVSLKKTIKNLQN